MMTTDRIVLKEMRAADGGARLLLTLTVGEGEGARVERLALLTARLERLPHVGEIDGDTYCTLVREAAVCDAIARGLRCLGAAGASRAALAMKLVRRGIAPDVARAAVGEIVRMGLLDEERGVAAEVKKGIAKHWGDRRVLAELAAKGYGKRALAVAEELLAGEAEQARLAVLLCKKPRPASAGERAKLVASLLRYGYELALIEKMI